MTKIKIKKIPAILLFLFCITSTSYACIPYQNFKPQDLNQIHFVQKMILKSDGPGPCGLSRYLNFDSSQYFLIFEKGSHFNLGQIYIHKLFFILLLIFFIFCLCLSFKLKNITWKNLTQKN
jgi:preprotein translocase subunit SecG